MEMLASLEPGPVSHAGSGVLPWPGASGKTSVKEDPAIETLLFSPVSLFGEAVKVAITTESWKNSITADRKGFSLAQLCAVTGNTIFGFAAGSLQSSLS